MVHQVTSDAPAFDTSPMIQPGEAFFQTMPEAGTFAYVCPPHPGMIGTVVVT
jgi:plastocyanin